jgi:predicted TIM-barrel fold metal-dependent hydrolase
VLGLSHELKYSGPIFDAHTHIIDIDVLPVLVKIGIKYGVKRSLLICHSLGAKKFAEKMYPGRFVLAKYIPSTLRFTENVDAIVREVKTLREEGYALAKMQSAPMMRGRAKVSPDILKMDSFELDPLFEALADEDIPFLLHLSDPDTYYEKRYNDQSYFSSKEVDLQELEGVVARHPEVKLQLAHFAAQPEVRRLNELGKWFNTYNNFNVDMGSARWMVRELGKDPSKSRAFLTKYADRILFATDCVAYTPEIDYYEGRYKSLRLLLESDAQGVPLPFTDADTVDSGGTFINGLALSDSVCRKIYWENAERLYRH